jgi:hypothetical protein
VNRNEGTCGDCGRLDSEGIDFLVATPIWNYVMAGQAETTYTIREGLFDKTHYPRVEGVGGVVCLACFDKRARDLGIPYRESLVVFGVGCWMGYDVAPAGQMPLVATDEERDWDEEAMSA